MDHSAKFWKKLSSEGIISVCWVAFFCLVLDMNRAYLGDLCSNVAILADDISDLGRTCWRP